jgi:hypothetical protein
LDVVPQPVLGPARVWDPVPLLLAQLSSPAGLADDEEPPELADASSNPLELWIYLGLGHVAYRTNAVAEEPDASESGFEAEDVDKDGVPEDERPIYGRESAQYGGCVLYEWVLSLGSSDSVMVLLVSGDDLWSRFGLCLQKFKSLCAAYHLCALLIAALVGP